MKKKKKGINTFADAHEANQLPIFYMDINVVFTYKNRVQ